MRFDVFSHLAYYTRTSHSCCLFDLRISILCSSKVSSFSTFQTFLLKLGATYLLKILHMHFCIKWNVNDCKIYTWIRTKCATKLKSKLTWYQNKHFPTINTQNDNSLSQIWSSIGGVINLPQQSLKITIIFIWFGPTS